MKGLYVDIYKHQGQSYSNKGISEHVDTVILLCPGGYVDPAESDKPCVILQSRSNGHQYAVPCEFTGEPLTKSGMIGPMMGGTFIYSSDSRYRAACGSYPLALHDRWETAAQYDALSR